ncbi:MAG: spore coat associated protein CotJA [Eubacteriales bacterium]|nr:spore coat associated protein CotJA [Eubacteriales bacterium]
MTLNDIQPGFEEDMGLLKASTCREYSVNPGTVGTGNQVLAMAYVPYQEFTDYFTSYADALDNGSLFKNLIKTFDGKRVIKR